MSGPALRTPDDEQYQCDDCTRIWLADALRYPDEESGDSALRCPDCGGECFLWELDEGEEAENAFQA